MTFFHATFWRSRLRHWLLKLISNLAPLAACALPAAAAVPPHERQVLVDLFASTSGQQWTTKSNWLDADPCDAVNGWFGIYCDSARAHVTYIALPNNNLRGKLPETLNQLTMLKSVELTSNFLWGPIPSLQGMTALFSFDVRDNLFTGSVPSLAGLTSLAGFDVSDNKLTGPVPAAPPSLWDNSSRLCPNYLNTPSPTDTAWNMATSGQPAQPWSASCSAPYRVSVSITAAPGTASPPGYLIPLGSTATFSITPPAGQVVNQVSSGCGVPFFAPPLVTPGPLTTFTTPVLGDSCLISVTYRAALPGEGNGGGNAAAVTSVPTLSTWGLLLLGWLATCLALFGLRMKPEKSR